MKSIQKKAMKKIDIERTAIDQTTGEDALAAYAISSREYKCPCCDELLIIRKGEKNRHHFAHYSSSKEEKCEYYDGPSMYDSKYMEKAETRQHIQGKKYFKKIVEEKTIIVSRPCATGQCNTIQEFVINRRNPENEVISIEHPMKLKDGRNITADLAKVDQDTHEVKEVFEIYKSSRTLETNRPDLIWYEFNQQQVYERYHDQSYNTYETILLTCIRCNIKCQRCVHAENMLLNRQQIEEKEKKNIEDRLRFKITFFSEKFVSSFCEEEKDFEKIKMFKSFQEQYSKKKTLSSKQLWHLNNPVYLGKRYISFEYWQKNEEELLKDIKGREEDEDVDMTGWYDSA